MPAVLHYGHQRAHEYHILCCWFSYNLAVLKVLNLPGLPAVVCKLLRMQSSSGLDNLAAQRGGRCHMTLALGKWRGGLVQRFTTLMCLFSQWVIRVEWSGETCFALVSTGTADQTEEDMGSVMRYLCNLDEVNDLLGSGSTVGTVLRQVLIRRYCLLFSCS